MCVLEQEAKLETNRPLRVFGSDVSDLAVRTARAGTYPDSITEEVSPERLRRFFIALDRHYKVGQVAREACVFACHDITQDPPFSRMDLICCRGLLSLLDPATRRRALATVHYALQPGGILMVGTLEDLDADGLFAASPCGQGIYVRSGTDRPVPPPAAAIRARSTVLRWAPDTKDRRIAQLKRDLDNSREQVAALLDVYDSADEVLRSASDETLNANEEIQNINEELQTAKEQVQSANVELETLNRELEDRNRELTGVADDLLNVLDTLDIPIVMFAADVSVRRFTRAAEKVFNLIPSDLGRPLQDLRANLDVPDLSGLVRRVIETDAPVDRTVEDAEGRACALRIRPYRMRDGRVAGAVLILMQREGSKPS